MSKVSLYLDERFVKKDGRSTLKIRYSENSKAKYISTQFSIMAIDWDKDAQRVKKSYGQDWKHINIQLAQLVENQEERIDKGLGFGIEDETQVSAEFSIRQMLQKMCKVFTHTASLKVLDDLKIPDDARIFSKAHLNKIDSWVSDTIQGASYREIISKNIVRTVEKLFDIHDIGFKIKRYNLKTLEKHVTIAHSKNVLSALELAELCYIAGVDAYAKEKINDFLCSFFLCGANYKDVLNAVGSYDGVSYKFTREKSISKSKIARTISVKPCFFAINAKKASHSSINARNYYLKELSTALFGKGITINCARHSWGTIASNAGIPIDVIAKCLGHAPARITDLYLRDHYEDIETAAAAVFAIVEQHLAQIKANPRKNLAAILQETKEKLFEKRQKATVMPQKAEKKQKKALA